MWSFRFPGSRRRGTFVGLPLWGLRRVASSWCQARAHFIYGSRRIVNEVVRVRRTRIPFLPYGSRRMVKYAKRGNSYQLCTVFHAHFPPFCLAWQVASPVLCSTLFERWLHPWIERVQPISDPLMIRSRRRAHDPRLRMPMRTWALARRRLDDVAFRLVRRRRPEISI